MERFLDRRAGVREPGGRCPGAIIARRIQSLTAAATLSFMTSLGSPSSDDQPRPAPSQDVLGPGGKVDPEALFRLYEQAESDDEGPVTVRFRLSRDLNKRLDRYLVDRIPHLSRTSLQRLIREQAVMVNGRVPKTATRLRQGDEVLVVLPPPPSQDLPAEPIPLEYLYEDEHLVVINKQDDIIVHPARGHQSGTIINALAYHFQHESSGSLSPVGEELARPGVVHRLDRHTTGVMVVAKSETAHWRLGRQFEDRTTDKRYLAVVHGVLEPHADVIELPLGKHPTAREKYAVRWDQTGKASVTIYRVREVYKDFTLVEVELKSGRTHQIRVHFSHLGYPIVGDDMYGGRHLTYGDITGAAGAPGHGSREPLITRQALHAARLGFAHPTSHRRNVFHAPLPNDLATLLDLLRTYQFVSAPKIAGAEIELSGS